MKRTIPSGLSVLALVIAAPGHAAAPIDTSRPMTLVVPFAAGSATDQLARALGQSITESTGQTVLVTNKPGASAMIGAQDVARAAPDGYTVLITTNTTHAANEHLYKQLPYDPVKDYEPITALGQGGQILVVNTQSPVKSVGELIALAKEQPGKLSFGSGSSSSRIAGELFKQMAGVDILHVPYKSNPPALTDLVGNQISMMITDSATGLPQIQGGRVRALGVTSKTRSVLVPEVPTIDEAGVPGYEMGYWFAAYAPKGTPQPVVTYLHDTFVAATKAKAAQSFYSQTGTTPFTNSPKELAEFQAAESAKWGKIIQEAGIQPE
ncbi:tripartite tricarboxylate transporter substrate binding protein [Achromobacter sp. GG226]|uniref:Bug family tripartite tricarboxylate transporter substrate binding protein n=1 Tax=Verticiella alkaliphila TaxID=2779529 RepID=UPI001C0D6F91|nr:tripartite tricarboxylate transporter substrate binding protein [Verticiella sp. GG226]MBU4611155.1 tripartite tricarboxylate transporter substrate binding protein [Verticiella sp. GG226]